MVTYTFDKVNQIIEVDLPDTEITIQDLHDAIRDWEDELANLEVSKVCDTFGKQELGGGVLVGLTMVLYDWKVKFADRAGPSYIICDISGGNLVTYDGIEYVNPVEPSSYVTVTRTSSSSATLQELSSIQHSSFNNGVTIDVINGTSGTTFPTGTSEQPVDNLSDAKTIATERGFDTFYVIGDIIFGASDNIDSYTVIGQNPTKTTITFVSGASTEGCEFREATLTGTIDGSVSCYDCTIGQLTYVQGEIINCMLSDTITLAGTETVHVVDCYSGVAGGGTPTINMGGSGRGLGMRAYSGGIELTNKSGSESVSVDLVAGQVVLDSSVTNGDIVIRGVGFLTDNSVGATVNEQGLISQPTIADAVWDESVGARAEGTMAEAIRHIEKRPSHAWYVDANTGNDSNAGTDPSIPFLTIGKAITEASANDVIKLASGTYTEAGIDLNVAGVKIEGEFGTYVTGGGGTGMIISAQGCQVQYIVFTPAAGQTALSITASSVYCYRVMAISAGVGFYTAPTAQSVILERCGSHATTSIGFNLQGPYGLIYETDSRGVGAPSRGYYLSNASAASTAIYQGNSQGNATTGFEVVAGVANVVILNSFSGGGDGAKIDNGTGTKWVNFNDTLDATMSEFTDTGSFGEAVNLIRKIETNRWKIDNNQMTIYDDDDVTPLHVFDLKNEAGNPAEEDVYERVPT